MKLAGQTFLILGGSGLVGRAIAKKLLERKPDRIVLVALAEHEIEETLEDLRPYAGKTQLQGEWGNVFLPRDAARFPRGELLGNPDLRAKLIGDLFGKFSRQLIERSQLFYLLNEYKPDAVVDCINTATAFAYQDVFTSASDLLTAVRAGTLSVEQVERHVLTLTMPQLIRHVQIAVEAMRITETTAYVKIGTSGTGGMGFNIPYTHSEERPSRTLLTKSAVAGAHSILLFLLARTPDGPTAIEIKPTAAIAWRKITHGPVRRGGRPIPKFDCPEPLPVGEAFLPGAVGWTDLNEPVESVYIDVGENGVFARDEFDTVTSLGQMEFITPEEVADYVVMELEGRTTGKDIVAALDSATAGPTYNAGVLRSAALDRLDALEAAHGVRSVGFEMLGPPRLTKILYESFILSRIRDSVRALAESKPDDLANDAVSLIGADNDLRALIVSVGLPIILDGEKVYRGQDVLVPPDESDLDELVARGWVDLRRSCFKRWVERAVEMVALSEQRRKRTGESGSDVDWVGIGTDDKIAPARFARWVLGYEDGGARIKR